VFSRDEEGNSMRRGIFVLVSLLALGGLARPALADGRYRDHDRYYDHYRDHDRYWRDRYDRGYRGCDDYDRAADEYRRYLDWTGDSWSDYEFDRFRDFRCSRRGASWSDFRYRYD
jgi:hypothetical protein